MNTSSDVMPCTFRLLPQRKASPASLGRCRGHCFVHTKEIALMPTAPGDGNVGYDLRARTKVTIASGKTDLVPLGIHTAVAGGFYPQLMSRSSWASKGILVLGWGGA